MNPAKNEKIDQKFSAILEEAETPESIHGDAGSQNSHWYGDMRYRLRGS